MYRIIVLKKKTEPTGRASKWNGRGEAQPERRRGLSERAVWTSSSPWPCTQGVRAYTVYISIAAAAEVYIRRWPLPSTASVHRRRWLEEGHPVRRPSSNGERHRHAPRHRRDAASLSSSRAQRYNTSRDHVHSGTPWVRSRGHRARINIQLYTWW